MEQINFKEKTISLIRGDKMDISDIFMIILIIIPLLLLVYGFYNYFKSKNQLKNANTELNRFIELLKNLNEDELK